MEPAGKLIPLSPHSLDAPVPVIPMPSSFRYLSRNEAIPRTLLTAARGQIPADELDAKVRRSNIYRSAKASLSRPLPPQAVSLVDLGHVGTYASVAAFLDTKMLVHVDATCKLLRDMNRAFAGPWFTNGTDEFRGLELAEEGLFQYGEEVPRARLLREDWKQRFKHVQSAVQCFRAPFHGSEIKEVEQPDEIAYCCCHLRTDLLSIKNADDIGGKVYIEFEISQNPDNVSLAIVDFEAGGCSSVTFSPDTGAVIRERKVNETPRRVEGSYIQPLETITAGQRFEGFIGFFYHAGHLAFFRRHSYIASAQTDDDSSSGHALEPQLGPWETTGFVTDISWAEGCRLTPCLAFRNEGGYNVRMVRRGLHPPIIANKNTAAYTDAWNRLDWDAAEQEELEQ